MSEDQGTYETKSYVAKIKTILDKREAIYNFAEEWSRSVCFELGDILKDVKDRQELEELSNAIYWNEADLPRFPNISLKSVIKDTYLAITGERFQPKKAIELPCPACGESVVAGSIGKLKELESKSESWLSALAIADLCCEDCYQLTLEHTHRKGNVLLYPNQYIHQNIKMDYQEFLQSDYWKTVREFIKNRDGGECVVCGSRNDLHVHHKNYRHRGYEFKNELHTLCGKCHAKFHGKDGKS